MLKENGAKPKEKCKSIIQFSHTKARKFFLKAESYCGFNLPPYFVFENLINKVSKLLGNSNLNDYKEKTPGVRDLDDINHTVLSNKNGQYAWRPLQLIHPAFYVALVHEITKKESWAFIQNRFIDFNNNSQISCASLPIESLNKRHDKDKQISKWWLEVEQKSI